MSHKDEITQYSWTDLRREIANEQKIARLNEEIVKCSRQIDHYKSRIKYFKAQLDLLIWSSDES
jgi:hypothetical protein